MSEEKVEEQKAEDLIPQTDVQQVQKCLYDLFTKHVFGLDGVDLQVEGELPEQFISKSLMVDTLLQVLNELGEELTKDKDSK